MRRGGFRAAYASRVLVAPSRRNALSEIFERDDRASHPEKAAMAGTPSPARETPVSCGSTGLALFRSALIFFASIAGSPISAAPAAKEQVPSDAV